MRVWDSPWAPSGQVSKCPLNSPTSPRGASLAQVNAMLREQLDQANLANQALNEDIRKVTSDWTRSCKELEQREAVWRREEEVSGCWREHGRGDLAKGSVKSGEGQEPDHSGPGHLRRAGLGHTCPGPGWPSLPRLVKFSVNVTCRQVVTGPCSCSHPGCWEVSGPGCSLLLRETQVLS